MIKEAVEVRISIGKDFDCESFEEFRSKYMETTKKTCDYTLDFSSVVTIDSAVLGLLIRMHKVIHKRSTIKIINANDQTKKMISLSKLDGFLSIQ